MAEVARRRWVCPWCQARYDIPAAANDPAACPKCEAKRAPPELLAEELDLPIPPHAREPEQSGSGTVARIVVGTVIGIAVLFVGIRLASRPFVQEQKRVLDESFRLRERMHEVAARERDRRFDAIIEQQAAKPALALLSFRWQQESGFAIGTGQVQNISRSRLENVAAVCSFYDEQRTFITSSEALTTFNPIMPGQISDFKVYETWNPQMKTCEVAFKHRFGAAIATEDRRQK